MISNELRDLCSGLALLDLGPEGRVSESTIRIRLALEGNDERKAIHQAGILLAILLARGNAKKWMLDKWEELVKEVEGGSSPKN